MTTRCQIIVKAEENPRREVYLYQHNDGHPTAMMEILSEMLYNIYNDYHQHGDLDWFVDPQRVSGSLIVNSVPVIPDSVKSALSKLEGPLKKKLQSPLFLDMPTIIPDIGRTPNCNYEYIITLKDDPIDNKFIGYILDVHRLQNNKKISELHHLVVNLQERSLVKVGDIDESRD